MEKLITNDYNLKEEDMTELVQRVKVFMRNSKNELIMSYSNHEYHCPGGHVEEKESLDDAVVREIREETGIVLKNKTYKPFAEAIGYYKDWPEVGKNRKIEIYYYDLLTEEEPDVNNMDLDEHEKASNFTLRKIKLDNLEDELIRNREEFDDPHGITKEMLRLLPIYKDFIAHNNK